MGGQFVKEAELVTRRIAQIGSLAAAAMFGLAFAVDTQPGVRMSPELVTFTAGVVIAFVGYALAWAPRLEALGSAIVIAGVVIAFFACDGPFRPVQGYAFLGIAAPAVLHLAAVAFHRARPQQTTSPAA